MSSCVTESNAVCTVTYNFNFIMCKELPEVEELEDEDEGDGEHDDGDGVDVQPAQRNCNSLLYLILFMLTV